MARPFSVDQIYRMDSSCRLSGFQTHRAYQDPRKAIVQRQRQSLKRMARSSGKFKPSDKNRKFFLDDMLKQKKTLPDFLKYGKIKDWAEKGKFESTKEIRVNKSAKKNTFIQQIENNLQKNPVPAVGKYQIAQMDLFNSYKSKNRNISPHKRDVEKGLWLDDAEKNAESVPGPGKYSTNRSTLRLSKCRIDDKQIFKRQQQGAERIRKFRSVSDRKPKDAQQYQQQGDGFQHPIVQSFKTFDSMQRLHYLRTFYYPDVGKRRRPSKKEQIKERTPGPSDYGVVNKWSEKSGRKPKPKYLINKDIYDKISKGPVRSIYH